MQRPTRRRLLIGGGAGVGLLVGWGAWPRGWQSSLAAAPGETVLGPFLTIARDGRITVALPQCEHGQGVYTTLAQVLADELGADWRTVGVEATPASPLYANPIAADALFGARWHHLPSALRHEGARRSALMLTGGSTSVRAFEAPLREAGAAARVLLARAAARRWDADWRDCGTEAGFVTLGERRLRFGALAAAAADERLPGTLPPRLGGTRLVGRSLPRLDAPAKVAGAANYAADIRLPDMVFASVRQGRDAASRLRSADRAGAERVPVVIAVVAGDHWVAAVANNWWAAEQGATALDARFADEGRAADDRTIAAALAAALAGGGRTLASRGDVSGKLSAGRIVRAEYEIAATIVAEPETPAATAQWRGDRLELWVATQAPAAARDAAAAALDVAAGLVTVHPMLSGQPLGGALEHAVVAQAAVLAVTLRRPVQLAWSRGEAQAHAPLRPPARARLSARLDATGAIKAWHAQVATPATGGEIADRLLPPGALRVLATAAPDGADPYAMAGAIPLYRLPAIKVEHHPAAVGIAAGHVRGGGAVANGFAAESFVDELARAAGADPLGYRLALLAQQPRLARCLSTAAALGGWDGGGAGSRLGLAALSVADSFVAVLAEVTTTGTLARLTAAVDVGRVVNPDVVRQVVESGLIQGAATAFGPPARWSGGRGGRVAPASYGALGLPTLATAPDLLVELIESDAAPGGVSDLAVPAVAPAIANALFAATGTRPRRLPFGAHA